jgi:hypothetical protein
MRHDEVEAGSGGARPQRGSYWRAVVVSGIVVVGAAVAAPMVLGATNEPSPETPMMGLGPMMEAAPLSQMLKSGQMMPGQTMQPGHMMGGAMMTSGHMMDPAEMARIMKSGQHMMDPGQMMGGSR